MCDYSLHLVASRPAKLGEKLISTSFHNSMTRGFASVEGRNVAVCLLVGTELAFEKEVQFDVGFGFSLKAPTRAQGGQVPSDRHDALEFPDGQTVLLTQLCEGQRATVLQFPVSPRVMTEEAQRHDSLAV